MTTSCNYNNTRSSCRLQNMLAKMYACFLKLTQATGTKPDADIASCECEAHVGLQRVLLTGTHRYSGGRKFQRSGPQHGGSGGAASSASLLVRRICNKNKRQTSGKCHIFLSNTRQTCSTHNQDANFSDNYNLSTLLYPATEV